MVGGLGTNLNTTAVKMAPEGMMNGERVANKRPSGEIANETEMKRRGRRKRRWWIVRLRDCDMVIRKCIQIIERCCLHVPFNGEMRLIELRAGAGEEEEAAGWAVT